MSKLVDPARRGIITAAGLTGIAVVAGFAPEIAAAAEKKKLADKMREAVGLKNKEQVTPPEDLMREHGVLDRALLVYEAAIAKLTDNQDFDPAVISDTASVIRDFINNYHEKSEEEDVFPRFRKANKQVDLVNTLLDQHNAGRRVTEKILQLSAPRSDADGRRELITQMRSFIAMYRPHAAREDTDLFPKLKEVVSSHEYDAMAEDFEKKEHELFGEDGFEKMVDRIAQIETKIGIHDLAQFTPHA